jgi:predicted TIM-barrel enzyme
VGIAAGTGIVAKCAERADADLIFVLSSSRSRNLGVPTTVTMGNAIDVTLGIYPEIDNVVDRTPIIGGIEGSDGSRRRIERVVADYHHRGFDGVANFPTLASSPSNLAVRDDAGVGIILEYNLIARSRELDVFSTAFVYDPAHTSGFINAGADLIVVRCGISVGGLSGPSLSELTPSQELERIRHTCDEARGTNSDALVLVEGGTLTTPAALERVYAETPADGVLCESSIERIVVEQAIRSEVAAFKSGELRATTTSVADGQP